MPVGIRSLQIGITDCHDQCAHWSRNDRGETKVLNKLGFEDGAIVYTPTDAGLSNPITSPPKKIVRTPTYLSCAYIHTDAFAAQRILPRPKKCPPDTFYLALLGRPFESLYHPPHKKDSPHGLSFFMGWVMGFEPTNTGTTIRCLRPLGDTHHISF